MPGAPPFTKRWCKPPHPSKAPPNICFSLNWLKVYGQFWLWLPPFRWGGPCSGMLFYSYAKQFSITRSKIGPLLNENNEFTSSSSEMAEILSKQYSSVFSSPSTDSPVFSQQEDQEIPTLTDITFSEQDIVDAIDELSNTSSSGPDGLSSIFEIQGFRNFWRNLKSLSWWNSVPSRTLHVLWNIAKCIGFPILRKNGLKIFTHFAHFG